MFVLKKVLLSLLTPPGLVLVLLLAGLIQLARGRGGRALLALGTLLLYLCGTAPAVNLLVRPLEDRYPPLADPRPTRAAAVVVLAAGGQALPNLPPHAGLAPNTLARLAEGVRLWRLLGGRPRLILTGGQVRGGTSVARLMGEAARSCFGVSAESLVLEEKALDTGQSARILAPGLRGRPFLLVTSALHMPRSVNDFRLLGAEPVPAPTDYRQDPRGLGYYSLMPSAARLLDAAAATHEWLGLAWQRVAAYLPRRLTQDAPEAAK
jgi:uncharacterized SAM-binding protein YcdF (DUF218 family)